ncbi:MAG: hypothetical protein LBC72_00740 [Spirochaetaceae bacterium]|jgi:hypothetical protein|nr:hypothetical protein [Spirochaetaceae bacterium]
MAEWQDELYQKTLDEETRGIERRLAADTACTADDLAGILRQLYEMAGSDWLGRGEVGTVILNAQIAAYELAVSRLRSG